jgi:hypothetical protein
MLDALSTTLTNTITLLVKSFRLSSLFPALCFVVTNYFLFLSHLPEYDTPTWLRDEGFGHLIFLTFLLTALIGYILNYLNFPLIYLAEGYPLRNTRWGRFMIIWYREQKKRLEKQAKLPGSEQKFYEEKLADYFPRDGDGCAPTALGNVMAAFEAYPSQRYGIDAVYMWPRLLPVLSKEKYAVFVEREKEGFDFFLNFSVLSGVLAVEGVLLRLLLKRPMFTWVALASGCVAFLSYYWGAVNCARNWGETIKTAFDLYRYQLAERLALEPFKDKKDETETWEAISYFIKRGRWDDFRLFRYPLPGRNVRAENEAARHGALSGGAVKGEEK